MKKFLAILTALLLVTSVAYSLDSMKDADMDGVAGQAGISIQQYGTGLQVQTGMYGLSWGDDDGEPTAGLNGEGAGHIAIRGATLDGLGSMSMGMTIAPAVASPIRLDVDAVGIYLSMGTVDVTVNTPDRIQLSVTSGTVDTFPGVISLISHDVLGDLAMDSSSVTLTMPSTVRIAPH